jgi:hypothetical protein
MSSCFAKNFQIAGRARILNKSMIAMDKIISFETMRKNRVDEEACWLVL